MSIRLTSFRSYRLATFMVSLIIVSGVELADAAESIRRGRQLVVMSPLPLTPLG